MPDTNKYFLYARKSTDAEDRQVRSIDAQLAELREISDRDQLTIVEELVEKQSAKTPGRPIFNSMLERIEAGEATGILAWHADRLARNSLDGGRIIYLIDTKKISRLRFFGTVVENTPQGKMMLNTEFGFSKYYVDSLSENTKRGHREKVKRGECPGRASLGYLNDYRTKRIIVDRERAPIVKEAFERYATGKETLDSIRVFLSLKGVRAKSGALVGRAPMSQILSNPIYYGHFKWGGEIYEGIHEPIISKRLYDAVQAVFTARWRCSPATQVRTPKAFARLLRCASCGYAVTAERQKGHTYYRCTRKSTRQERCAEPFIREEALDIEISAILSPFALSDDSANELLTMLAADYKSTAQASAAVVAEKRTEITALNERLGRLQDVFLDGDIDRASFLPEKAKIMGQKKTTEEQIAALTSGKKTWLEPFKEWILAAQSLGKVAHDSLLSEKGVLAKKVFGSNLVLGGQKARGEAVEPWSYITGKTEGIPNANLYYRARTFFQRNHGTEADCVRPSGQDRTVQECAATRIRTNDPVSISGGPTGNRTPLLQDTDLNRCP
jgi:site-specific DNA recombinase